MKPRIKFKVSGTARWSRVVREFEITLPTGARIWIITDGWKLLDSLIDQHRGGDKHYCSALGYA